MNGKDKLKYVPEDFRGVIYDAHISIMANHDLQWCMQTMRHMNNKYTVPIPNDEAEDLYKVLNKRFISWTGHSFDSWLRHKK